jgi:DNA-binding PucR family transcriptional regulator
VSPPAGEPIDRDALAAVAAALSGDVRVACGTLAGPGPRGFRASHEEAERARRVASLSRPRHPVTFFDDVSLLDLLSTDPPAARRFVQAELGELARADEATEAIRQTVLAVLAPRGGLAVAARELDLHRNTVLQRIQRAEALRGTPISERPAELYAALLVARGLGPAVL